MAQQIKANRIYSDNIVTKKGEKRHKYKISTEEGDFTFWGFQKDLDVAKQGCLITIDNIVEGEPFMSKKQFTFKKVLGIKPAPDKPVEPSNTYSSLNMDAVKQKGGIGRPTPNYTPPSPANPALPPLPDALSTVELEKQMKEALSKVAAMYNCSTDEIGVSDPITATVLTGLLQKQAQEFSIKLTQRIEATKTANINSVKRG